MPIESADFVVSHKKSRTAYANKAFSQSRPRVGMSGSLPAVNRHSSQMREVVKKDTLYVGEHDLGNGPYSVEIITATTK